MEDPKVEELRGKIGATLRDMGLNGDEIVVRSAEGMENAISLTPERHEQELEDHQREFESLPDRASRLMYAHQVQEDLQNKEDGLGSLRAFLGAVRQAVPLIREARGMTPKAALLLRDGLMVHITERIRASKHMVAYRCLEELMQTARVVIWHPDLQAVALRRSRSAFLGTAIGPETVPPQFWFYLPERHTVQRKHADTGTVEEQDVMWFATFVFHDPNARGLVTMHVGWAAQPEHQFEVILSFDRVWHPGEPCAEENVAVAAMLAFMDLEYVTAERHEHSRVDRRKAELKRRPPLPEIAVITLRRAFYEEHAKPAGEREPSNRRECDYSWLSTWHWRKASPLYKDQKARLIAPYHGGDRTKPLRPDRPTVYAVRR